MVHDQDTTPVDAGQLSYDTPEFQTYRFASRLRERLSQQAAALDVLIDLGPSDGQDGIEVATLIWRRTETLRQLRWVEGQMGVGR